MIDNVMYVFYTPCHVLSILGKAVCFLHIIYLSHQGFFVVNFFTIMGILDSLLEHMKPREQSVFFIQIRTWLDTGEKNGKNIFVIF